MESIMNIFDKALGALTSFNFTTDLLDVLLVTLVVYEAIKLLRGSRSFQVVKGMVLLLILFIIVKLVNMEASEYLLTILFENGLIILVILFAPELRKILEKVGTQSLKDISIFNFNHGVDYEKEVTDTVNDFCKAAGDMSDTKTGALVVFEKDSPLQDIVDSGTVVDAKSSAELFNGLFFKNSALHDGAVLVRNARIYAAGCILPLTQSTSIGSELGTRHRAAIGMSEQSDAVIVVVSEENGFISVAQNGSLKRNVTTGELRDILLKELIEENNENKNKKNNKKRTSKQKDNGGKKNEK